MIVRTARVARALVVAAVVLPHHLPAAPAPANAAVTIDNFSFGPKELTVPVGTTVKWVNHDDIPHTVANKDKLFRSSALDTDDSYSYTFASAGTFDYFCGLHPFMVGKIIVK